MSSICTNVDIYGFDNCTFIKRKAQSGIRKDQNKRRRMETSTPTQMGSYRNNHLIPEDESPIEIATLDKSGDKSGNSMEDTDLRSKITWIRTESHR